MPESPYSFPNYSSPFLILSAPPVLFLHPFTPNHTPYTSRRTYLLLPQTGTSPQKWIIALQRQFPYLPWKGLVEKRVRAAVAGLEERFLV